MLCVGAVHHFVFGTSCIIIIIIIIIILTITTVSLNV